MSSKTHIYQGWRDCVGIEPTRPGTQVSSSFEDCGGHQYPIRSFKMQLYQHFLTHQNRFPITTDTVFVQPLQIYYSY